jgi:hypothetical protein
MDWLSASVLTAIVVFVLRELFDLVRRKTSTGRQIEAYKIVLKRQCELNAWAVTKIRETLKTMEASPDDEFKLVQKQFHLRFEHSGGSWPIPNVHLEDMKDAMLRLPPCKATYLTASNALTKRASISIGCAST